MAKRGESGRFEVHSSGKSSKGSKVGTVVLIAVVLAVGGTGFSLWRDPAKMVGQIKDRGPLAVPAAYLLSFKGIKDDAKPVLFDALENGSPALKKGVARAIGTAQSMDVVANLGQAVVDDPDAGVRAAAADALGTNGHSAASRFLAVALEDGDLGVQAAACRAIGACGLDDFIPQLIDRLAQSDTAVQRAALQALEVFYGGDDHGMQKDPDAWRQWYEGR